MNGNNLHKHYKIKKHKKEFRIEEDVLWYCQYCGSSNDVDIDFSLSMKFDLVEECAVCCRPNRLVIRKDEHDYIYSESLMIDN